MSYGSPADYDMDSFLNLDQEFYSPSDAFAPSTGFSSSNVFSTPEHLDDGNAFQGPSHEYSRFKQLTGLPNGAVAKLAAIDEMDTYSTSHTTSQTDLFDMDYDTSSQSVQAFVFQDGSNQGGFVNPSVIQSQVPRVRHYPGVHTQAAEQAKTQAAAERKRQQEQGQQIMRQRQMQQQQHVSVPANASGHRSTSGSRASSDPAVEERISRLLDQMRHNSNASSTDAELAAQNMELESARISRMKKDDDEMDEDERLLASEEGKKLSSKERRQLRNKVSARAFRSRRKEYIGQLEGEVAVKAQELSELRAQNRQIQAQNQQLTQLTQTLLRHPAFSTFLEDMSNDPTIIAPLEDQNESVGDAETERLGQHNNTIKQENETQQLQHQQQDLEVHMASIPPTQLEFSMLNLGGSHWGSRQIGSHFQQSQVYAVTDLPRGPSLVDLKETRCTTQDDSTESSLDSVTSSTSLQSRLPWYHLYHDVTSTAHR